MSLAYMHQIFFKTVTYLSIFFYLIFFFNLETRGLYCGPITWLSVYHIMITGNEVVFREFNSSRRKKTKLEKSIYYPNNQREKLSCSVSKKKFNKKTKKKKKKRTYKNIRKRVWKPYISLLKKSPRRTSWLVSQLMTMTNPWAFTFHLLNRRVQNSKVFAFLIIMSLFE